MQTQSTPARDRFSVHDTESDPRWGSLVGSWVDGLRDRSLGIRWKISPSDCTYCRIVLQPVSYAKLDKVTTRSKLSFWTWSACGSEWMATFNMTRSSQLLIAAPSLLPMWRGGGGLMNIAGCINMDTHIAAVYSSFPWCGHSPDPIACIAYISVCS